MTALPGDYNGALMFAVRWKSITQDHQNSGIVALASNVSQNIQAHSMPRKERKKRRMYNLPTFVWHMSAIDHSVGHFVTLIRMSSESTRQRHTFPKFDDKLRQFQRHITGNALDTAWLLPRNNFLYALHTVTLGDFKSHRLLSILKSITRRNNHSTSTGLAPADTTGGTLFLLVRRYSYIVPQSGK